MTAAYAYVLLAVFSPVPVYVPRTMPPAYWTALKHVALALEVVGQHERWITNARSETNYVREHFSESKRFPPISDCQRFPDYETARRCREANSEWQHLLTMRSQAIRHRYWEYQNLLHEAQSLGKTWSRAECAACTTSSWAMRRRALQELRTQLGDADYFAGNMPCALPLHRLVPLPR